MKFLAAFATLAGLTSALPTAIDHAEEIRSWELLETHTRLLEARQSSETRNELQAGGACPPIIFIHARGSTEGGNLVRTYLLPNYLTPLVPAHLDPLN